MSDLVNAAVAALTEKVTGGFEGVAKFVIDGEGAIMLDADGVRAADEEADVTLTASSDLFQKLLEGETSATAAFMTGKLKVDGDMGMAMKLAGVFS